MRLRQQPSNLRLRELRLYRTLRIALLLAATLPHTLLLALRERLGIARPDPRAWERAHERAAARIERLATELQGATIKFAQVVGARPDVFPEPYVRRLSRFHDQVPPIPFAEFRRDLEQELGRPVEEVFAEIDPEPLAAASLAQVHRGRLLDGSEVAIKLQYPDVARIVPVDIANIRRATALVTRLTGLDLRTIAAEIAKFVSLELDFEREARAMERIAKDLAGDPLVVVPYLHPAWCGRKLIVMEYLDGTKITHLDELRRAGHEPAEVVRRVAGIYAAMIFEHGFFQGDPHPGNLLVLGDGRIGLLDFGMCKELPAAFGAQVAALTLAVLAGDAEATDEHAAALGLAGPGVDAKALQDLVGGLLDGFVDGASPLDVLEHGPVERVPEDLPLILRTFVLLGGLAHTLAPGQPVLQLELLYALVGAAESAAGAASRAWA